jgi:hypothetical protein
MDERAFWLEIRRAALTVVKAIEARYCLVPKEERQAATTGRRSGPPPIR